MLLTFVCLVFLIVGLPLVVVVVFEMRLRNAVCVCVLLFLLLLRTGNRRSGLNHSILRLHSHDDVDFVCFYW